MLGHMSVQNKICPDIYLYDLTLTQTYVIRKLTLNFGSEHVKSKCMGIAQVNTKSSQVMSDVRMYVHLRHNMTYFFHSFQYYGFLAAYNHSQLDTQ